MTEFKELNGSASDINLGEGYAIRAPGLRGRVRVHGAKSLGTRGPEVASHDFDKALSESSLSEVKVLELEVSSAPFPASASPIRGPEGADAFELRVPDVGVEFGQVVLSIDEAGALHWHFPLDNNLSVQPSTIRGANGSKVFHIPREIATPPSKAITGNRGLVSVIGRKILKVLVYPIADAVLGPLTLAAISKWESQKRPYNIRRFLPNDRALLSADDWSRLAKGRSLLFVHGTFSSSQSGFGDLPALTLAELAKRYENRLFAFDHPTLSVSPEDNVQWFFSQIPAGTSLDVDIICHSRGGLVSRCMGVNAHSTNSPQFSLRRLVLAGVPNQGTLLAHPDHMVEFLDRMTTALNVFPGNFVTEILEAILTVVKVIGHAGLTSLEGLAAMKPGTPLLAKLDRSSISEKCTIYGVGGDFEPIGAGLGAAFGTTVADAFVDRVFGKDPNDLVVPTDGMRRWNNAIQIPDDRFLSFTKDQGVMHTRYFVQPETSAGLLNWLTGQ